MAMPITVRNKLVSILTAIVVFTALATLAVVAVGERFHVGMTNAQGRRRHGCGDPKPA